jgi:Tfp pilus assembly major pilin PilA
MAKSYNKILLDVGVVTLNKGEIDEVVLGFTRGGDFTDGMTLRTIEVDGRRMPIKGEKVVDMAEPVLNINALQMNTDNLDKAFCGSTITDPDTATATFTRSVNIVDADYITNVTYDGFTKDGKAVTITLSNALGFGPVALTFADKAEVIVPCAFMAHAADSTATTLPYSILIDESV